jgi:putative transposase
MVRPLRIEYEGAFYHITSRGNARAEIFVDDIDRRRLLEIFTEVVSRYGFLIHAYCLMSNHYHLLVETPLSNLSAGMRQLNGVYTQAFNRRHQRVGHLFQGRYKAVLVDRDEYLLELSRYIVLNPVRANLVLRPEEWKWSSYRAMIGMDKQPGFLHTNWLLSEFSLVRQEAQSRYRSFVEDAKGMESPLRKARGGWILGGKRFLEEMTERIKGKELEKGLKEIPKRERYAVRPSLREIFKEKNREEGIYEAIYQWGYKLREVGDYVGFHYSWVSRILPQKAKNKT